MNLIQPVSMTDALLISSTAPETDYSAWAAGTAYALGDRCIRTATHRIYERRVAGTTAAAPEADTINWLDIGPTNRWAMFDGTVGSVTTLATPLTVTLAPGPISHLALLDLQATSVRVQMTDGAGGPGVYDRTFTMADAAPIVDYWDYFFGEPGMQTELIVADLPPYYNGRITVTINNGTTAACGTLVAGTNVEIGDTHYGVSIGILDYSRKETDDFGVTTVVPRAYAKRIDVPVLCENTRLDYIVKKLAEVRAIPCVWVAMNSHSSMIVYGFYKDWSIDIQYFTHCEARLTIEGLI